MHTTTMTNVIAVLSVGSVQQPLQSQPIWDRLLQVQSLCFASSPQVLAVHCTSQADSGGDGLGDTSERCRASVSLVRGKERSSKNEAFIPPGGGPHHALVKDSRGLCVVSVFLLQPYIFTR